MGIPYYFSHVVKNHSNIIHKYTDIHNNIHNLYLDSNSIIYDSVFLVSKLNDCPNFEINLINYVCKKIEEYIRTIKPNNLIYIAFDGVAPVAKLEQQRNRRYKTMLEKQIFNKLYQPNNVSFDTTCITPGTKFMNKLNMAVREYFEDMEERYKVNRIIVSTSNEIGEGEHKIFEYIRNTQNNNITHKNVIYGLDADLIMLCINHIHLNSDFYLYRETPEFIKSLNSNLNPNEAYLLDINLFASILAEELSTGTRDRDNVLSDYILITMMLGNDFMPHFPAINIRTGGIDKVMNTYKHIFGKTNKYLYNREYNEINWGNLKKLIELLADNEEKWFKEEHKLRNRFENREYPVNNKEDMQKKYLNMPTKVRDNEHYINPYNDYWQQRYYDTLFHIDITDTFKKQISTSYLECLEWTMKYYTVGCIDFRYTYPYHYPPLLKDLHKYVPYLNTVMLEKSDATAINEDVLLAYVLPAEKLNLLNDEAHNKLKNSKNYNEWYDTSNIRLEWAYCKYIWESHAVLPEINIDELERVLV